MTFKRGNIEKQIQHVPNNVRWCKKCVVSNQRPRIIFDEEGICSGCRNTEYKNMTFGKTSLWNGLYIDPGE